jgi:hypothetical protein
MSNRYVAYAVQGSEETTMYQTGRIVSPNPKLVPITKKKDLIGLVKEDPEKIILKLLPSNYIEDAAFQGPLSLAPKDSRYVIEGRETKARPKNSFEWMLQENLGSKVITFFASIEWSEKTKKWRVTS